MNDVEKDLAFRCALRPLSEGSSWVEIDMRLLPAAWERDSERLGLEHERLPMQGFNGVVKFKRRVRKP